MLVAHVEYHASAVSLLESGEQRFIEAINNNIYYVKLVVLCFAVFPAVKSPH